MQGIKGADCGKSGPSSEKGRHQGSHYLRDGTRLTYEREIHVAGDLWEGRLRTRASASQAPSGFPSSMPQTVSN